MGAFMPNCSKLGVAICGGGSFVECMRQTPPGLAASGTLRKCINTCCWLNNDF